MPDNIIHLNEDVLKGQLNELVRGTVEETLNKLLDQEAGRIANAGRYERSEQRQDTRAGYLLLSIKKYQKCRRKVPTPRNTKWAKKIFSLTHFGIVRINLAVSKYV